MIEFDAFEDALDMKQFYPSCHSKNLDHDSDKRASPEEEFFKLSCLALKIQYSER